VTVTLSELARASARRAGVPELDVKRARHASTSERELPDCLLVYAELDDGRRLKLRCQPSRPSHVMTLDLLPRRT
jgi:hypothetical protein